MSAPAPEPRPDPTAFLRGGLRLAALLASLVAVGWGAGALWGPPVAALLLGGLVLALTVWEIVAERAAPEDATADASRDGGYRPHSSPPSGFKPPRGGSAVVRVPAPPPNRPGP